MEPVAQPTNGHIRKLTPEEAKTLFDQEARQHFGMSGKAFIAAWESGQFDDDPDCHFQNQINIKVTPSCDFFLAVVFSGRGRSS